MGLPGSLEWLGRAGINKAGEIAGVKGDLVSPKNAFPSGSDVVGAYENNVGKLYQPQTTAGEYARTIGEFAPGMLFPGAGVGARLVGNVVAPAVLSETAGQATKGTSAEPIARLVGGLAGGFVPGIGARVVSPNITPAEKLKAVATLDREGVRLSAGDRGANTAMRYAEDATQAIPFAGGPGRAFKQGQAEDFTAAALKRAGVNARLATPEVIDQAFVAIGRKFDDLANNTSISATSAPLKTIPQVSRRYTAETNALKRDPRVALIADEIDAAAQAGRTIQGKQYSKLRSDLETAARETTDATTARAFRDISRALDYAVERSMNSRALREEWRATRGDYRKLLAIREASLRAGEKAADGIITPAALASASKAQGRAGYARGKHPYEDLAQAGVQVLTPLPQSGTAPRAMAQGLLTLGGAGAVGGGGGDAIMGGVGGLILGALSGRALMSRPVQNMLSNQIGANTKNLIPGRMSSRAAAPSALGVAERASAQPLQVTVYPPNDPRNRNMLSR